MARIVVSKTTDMGSSPVAPALKLDKVLVYYDGVQQFSAHDQFGCKYICTLVRIFELCDIYYCKSESKSELLALAFNGISVIDDIPTIPLEYDVSDVLPDDYK